MLLQEKTVVVAGTGEVGRPIFQLCRGGFAQVIAEDPRYGEPERPAFPVAALHVAFPGSLPNFVEAVDGYVRKYDPEVVLIHSSTRPGDTDKLIERFGADRIVHTQVHGKHQGDRMRRDMLRYPKFVATTSDAAFERARDVLIAMGHPPENVVRLSRPLAGEIAKLLATTYFGYLIAWVQEVERLSDKCGVGFDELMSFARLETDDWRIETKFPGVIGGHCVLPNIAILRETFPCELWDFITKSNELKKARDAEHA
jgi:hypothetical protein